MWRVMPSLIKAVARYIYEDAAISETISWRSESYAGGGLGSHLTTTRVGLDYKTTCPLYAKGGGGGYLELFEIFFISIKTDIL